MPTFAYHARNSAGERVSGTSEAPDQRAALEALRELGLFVTQLVPAGRNATRNASSAAKSAPLQVQTPEIKAQTVQSPAEQSREIVTSTEALATAAARETVPAAMQTGTGVAAPSPSTPLLAPAQVEKRLWLYANAKELSLFYRQMNAMLHAGTSLWHALRTLSEHASNKALRQASQEMAAQIEAGSTWSQTMRAYPGLFSELAIGMVQAGESGGFLDRMCLKLSEYCERDYELQQTIKRETWYPKLLVFCAVLIPSVVPVVIAGVAGGNMLSAWFSSGAPFALLIIGMVWFGWKAAQRATPAVVHSNSVRLWIDSLKLYLPIIGKTSRALATVKFSRALGALYSAGVGPHKAVKMAADACGNMAIAQKAHRITFDLENGAGLTDSLAKTGQFPGVALQMMRTGEESGNLDGQLEKVADFLEADAETTIKQSVKVLGIVVFLLIAMYIGAMVMKFYVGYFNSVFTAAEG